MLLLAENDEDDVSERENDGECVVDLDGVEDAVRPAVTVSVSVAYTDGGGDVYAVAETDAVTELDARGLRLEDVLLVLAPLADPRVDADTELEALAHADAIDSVGCGLTVLEPHAEDEEV